LEVNNYYVPIILNGSKNIDCCVCLEEANYQTLCKHGLCPECMARLPNNAICPLCRQEISYLFN